MSPYYYRCIDATCNLLDFLTLLGIKSANDDRMVKLHKREFVDAYVDRMRIRSGLVP